MDIVLDIDFTPEGDFDEAVRKAEWIVRPMRFVWGGT